MTKSVAGGLGWQIPDAYKLALRRNVLQTVALARAPLFRFGRTPLGRHQRDFAGYAIDLGLKPSFIGCSHRGNCFVDGVPSFIDLAKVGIGFPR